MRCTDIWSYGAVEMKLEICKTNDNYSGLGPYLVVDEDSLAIFFGSFVACKEFKEKEMGK